MAPAASKLLGEGSVCSVLIKKLHPADIIARNFPNAISNQRLDDLVAFKHGKAKRRGGATAKSAIYFTTASIPDVELWASTGFVKVKQSCPEDKVFIIHRRARSTAPTAAQEELEAPARTFDLNEDIARVRELGLAVDDDREPAPENVPAATSNRPAVDETTGLFLGQQWNWDGQCQRKLVKETREKASFHHGWKPKGPENIFDDYQNFIALEWFKSCCVDGTTANLVAAGEPGTDLGEMLTYIGLKYLMATVVFSQRQFFSSAEYDEVTNPCPYRLSKHMPSRRIELLDQHIAFTDEDPPAYVDKFWEIRRMFHDWRENMKCHFIPSWVSVLDESMVPWTQKFTCPGWVFCPRKPHPQGNELHTICCGETGILYDLEMVEGDDAPPQIVPDFSGHSKTAGLLLRLTRSIHHTAKYVVLDSGFCVLKALIELRKVGVFAGALIKKRRYWPALVAGDAMDDYFNDKAVGDVAAVEGELDGVRYNIWAMKDAGYVTKIMGTASGLIYNCDRQRSRSLEGNVTARFKYTEPYQLHYDYRHLVDDHNNLRHAVPSIEMTLTTQRWAMRQFQFMLAISEVNLFLTYKHFLWGGHEQMKLLEFRRMLAWALIKNNIRLPSPEADRRITRNQTSLSNHNLLKCPRHTAYFDGRDFIVTAPHPYNQFTCKHPRCQKRVRTYCCCTPGRWLCNKHYLVHYKDCVSTEFIGN
jgi:hypothetical protein